jgi:thiamine kinase-like enzyme
MENSSIFISPMTVNEKGKKKLKTKSEMDEDEYKKVCDRMKQLRDNRKEKIKERKNAPPPDPVKQPEPIIKEVIREVIVEKPVDRIVEKIVEKPVERIVEKIVEVERSAPIPVPEKPKQKKDELFDDDDIRSELRSMKALLNEMKAPKQQEQPKAIAPVAAPVVPPQKFVFGGVYGGFRPY